MKIKHIISTRYFSVNRPIVTKMDRIAPWEKLLKNNFLVSLSGQTNKNFTIFVIFHDDWRKHDYYVSLEKELSAMGVVAGAKQEIDVMAKSLWDDYDRMIVSRLDCDDLAGATCVDTIQKFSINVTSPVIYGFDNSIVADVRTGYFFSDKCDWQRSQMQSVIYNTHVTPKERFFNPNNWSHSNPRTAVSGADYSLVTNHNPNMACYFRHEHVASRDKVYHGKNRVFVDTDDFIKTFGTMPTLQMFSYSVTTSISYDRLSLMNTVFRSSGLPTPRYSIGCMFGSYNPLVRTRIAHKLIMELASSLDWPYVIVFEDDAYPCKTCYNELRKLSVPKSDVALLGYLRTSTGFPVKQDNEWYTLAKDSCLIYGAHAYVIYRNVLDRVIANFSVSKHTQEDLWNRHDGLDVVVRSNPLFIQYTKNKSINKHIGYTYFGCSETPPDGFSPVEEYTKTSFPVINLSKR